MAQVNHLYRPTRLVDGVGNFNTNIGQHLNLAHDNCSIAAVSIMGVQSSGKSTLLNQCFHTDFQEMDANRGMSQTTTGIWIAKCSPPNDGSTKILVIDTEGSDGSEKGQKDDTTFEKKITVFCLAMSNTVIFNMKCDNVNLYQGASRPLLETAFKVMLRKFSTPRQVNLVFVLRDKNMCPLDILRSQLIEGLQKMWQGMSKPQDNMNAALEDYFKIEVMVMSNYVHHREDFDKDVEYLRGLIYSLVQHGETSRASAFTALAERNWKEIMEDKILNLNLNRITVERVLCHNIAKEKIQNFRQDKSWLQIIKDVKSGTIVQGFGKAVSSIIDKYLSQYDKDTLGIGEIEIDQRRKQLTEKLLKDAERTHLSLVENMRNATFENSQKKTIHYIKGGGKLEGVDPSKFITEFKDLLEDANVQQANWNHTAKRLKKLESELASNQERASFLIDKQNELQKDKQLIWTGATTLGLQAIASSVLLGLAVSLPGPGTVVSVGVSTALQGAGFGILSLASIGTTVAGIIGYNKRKKQLDEACLRDPDLDRLRKQL